MNSRAVIYYMQSTCRCRVACVMLCCMESVGRRPRALGGPGCSGARTAAGTEVVERLPHCDCNVRLPASERDGDRA
jgi:hypothetical protein